MDWTNSRIDALLELALQEDQAADDATTNLTIDADLRATATILARQEMVVCGLGSVPRFLEIFARLNFAQLDRNPQARSPFEIEIPPEITDGARVQDGTVLAVIRSSARALLSTERVILNLMQHLSGIATQTRQYVDAIEGAHPSLQARVLDTRKTIPGLRTLEKYAVLTGGGTNHRMDLASGILIKNNHISLGGGLPKALTRALDGRQPGQRVQVEVRTPQELDEALVFGAEAILLDNMTPAEVKRSVDRIRQYTRELQAAGEPERWISAEASGGIVLENIRAYAETGVDFISVGALTHSAKAADISMRISAETA
jgi:nicotinate-nucleotide pyrophosphorylase (carboxylating)